MTMNWRKPVTGALLAAALVMPTCGAAGQSSAWTEARMQCRQATATISKARRTLSQLDRLLQRINNRRRARIRAAGRARTRRQTLVAPVKAAEVAGGWTTLFDGTSLDGWARTDFGGGGDIHLMKSFRGGPAAVVVDAGESLSGLNWTREVPKTNYEIAVEAMKIDGSDFMCGLTFPVADSYATLILGGWGGTLVGISCIEYQDASENATTKFMPFPKDHWFDIHMRVTPNKLEAWLDGKQIVDQVITGKAISLRRGEIDKSVPLGLATYQTSSAFRSVRIRSLDGK